MTTTPQLTLTLDKTLPNLEDIRNNFSAIVVAGEFLWLGGDEGTQIDRMTVDSAGNYGAHRRVELASLLPDIATHACGCRFVNCTHRSEPDCAVREATARGEVAASRLRFYQELYDELSQPRW